MRTSIALSLLAFFFFLTACGDSDAERETSENNAPGTSEEAASGENSGGEVVNFREIQSLLPEDVAGLERTDFSGQTTGAMGYNISVAEATYEDSGTRLDIVITDTGGLISIATGMASWTTLEIDRETKDGYERTTTINGYKAFEQYDRRRRRGELSLFVGDRFVVVLEGRNIEEEILQKAVGELKLKKLSNL